MIAAKSLRERRGASASGAARAARPHRLPSVFAAASAGLALSVLLGWHIRNPWLIAWVPGRTPLVYNTAVSLLLLAAALFGFGRGRDSAGRLLVSLASLPPLLTLLEYLRGTSLGIDQLLMPAGNTPGAGRIAPNTCVCLLLIACALLVRSSGARGARAVAGPILSTLALGIGFVSVSGYVTGFATFGWGAMQPMAMPTSVTLTLLCLAVLSLEWQWDAVSGGGVPPWLYLGVTLAAIVITVSLWQAVAAEEDERIRHEVTSQLESVKLSVLSDMRTRTSAVSRLARRLERGWPHKQAEWDLEMAILTENMPGFRTMAWADPDLQRRWVFPRQQSVVVPGSDAAGERRLSAIAAARQMGRLTISRPFRLSSGALGIQAYAPVFGTAGLQGYIVAEFQLDKLFPEIVGPTLAKGYGIEIYDGEERIYRRAAGSGPSRWERQALLDLENARWTVKISPTAAVLARTETAASRIVLGAGLLLSFLLGCAVYLAQAARQRTQLAERARAEMERQTAARLRAEQELSQFFELSLDLLCIAGFDGYFKRVNAAWAQTLGTPVERLMAEPFRTFIHPDDQTPTEEVVRRQGSGYAIRSFENRYRAADGSFRWLRWNSCPDPERGLIFAAARDITVEKAASQRLRDFAAELEIQVDQRTLELQAANRALRESEELFRRIFEDAPIGAALVGLDRHLTHVNRAMCDLLGYTGSELVGMTLADITYADDLPRSREMLDEMLDSTSSAYRLTKRYLHKDGRIVWAELTATLLKDESGAPARILGMIENITERRRDEEHIAALNDELEARIRDLVLVNQELESFNYSVSHDLRAPLRHIDAFSRILTQELGPALAPGHRRYLELVCESARKMGRMVDALLELSHMSRQEIVRRPTDLGALVQDVLAELKPQLGGTRIDFRIGALPTVECDPRLIHILFSNLLSNACKFSRLREHPVVEAGCAEESGQPVFFIRDNGVGFDMKYADKLFGAFQRLHRQEEFEGTGVGLASVQRVVHKHGGWISVEAQPDQGAMFRFTLGPAVDRAADAPEADVVCTAKG